MVGLRWNITTFQDGGSAHAEHIWAIVYLRQGETIDALTYTNGVTLYEPEQNCLVWAFGANLPTTITPYSGSTKTMRKMMVGDKIVFVSKGSTTNTTQFHGAIQLFQKG